MKERSKLYLETLLNLALIVVAITFSASLIARYVSRDTETRRRPPLEVGSKIDLSEIEWGKNDSTLVLVLSTRCEFCTESSSFYRRIVREVEGKSDTRLIAFFPQEVSEGRQYLRDNGVGINDVRRVSPAALGVAGVPSLILADRQGVVRDLWVGKLGSNVESLVMNALKGEAQPGVWAESIDSATLRAALEKKESLVVLNIDDRETYKREHIDTAVNIPFDELETRIEDELKAGDRIVIYDQGHDRFSNAAFEILKNNGFRNVAVLRGGFKKWKESAAQGAGQ